MEGEPRDGDSEELDPSEVVWNRFKMAPKYPNPVCTESFLMELILMDYGPRIATLMMLRRLELNQIEPLSSHPTKMSCSRAVGQQTSSMKQRHAHLSL